MSAASLALVPTADASVLIPAVDPLVALCQRWHAESAAAHGTDEQVEAAVDILNEIQDQISDTPATTREGGLAKLGVAETELRLGICPETEPDIVERLVISTFADVRKLLEAIA